MIASDGRRQAIQRFDLTVNQGYAAPVLAAVPTQTLREGERFGLQLAGQLPGGLDQVDGSTVTLRYSAPWLPGGASLNAETGWFEWTPAFSQRTGHLAMLSHNGRCGNTRPDHWLLTPGFFLASCSGLK